MSNNNPLEKCLKDLEKIRRKSLRKLSENCESEYMRDSAIREIQENYEHAKLFVGAVYRIRKKLDLFNLEQYSQEGTFGYFLTHLIEHIKQMRMLGQRH